MKPSCVLGSAFVHRHLNSPCSSPRHLKTHCCMHLDGLLFCGKHTMTTLSSPKIAEEEGRRQPVSAQPCRDWSAYHEVKSIPSSAKVVSTPCNRIAAELTSHKSIGVKRCAVESTWMEVGRGGCYSYVAVIRCARCMGPE